MASRSASWRRWTRKATDFSAQLAKIKASGADTLFVTTAVEQLTLILKQAKEQQLKARIISCGGSNSPDQLIDQAGDAANGSYHTAFFPPWFPEVTKNQEISKRYMDEWKKRGYNLGGLSWKASRGYDAVYVAVAAIKAAGKADPEAIRPRRYGRRHRERHLRRYPFQQGRSWRARKVGKTCLPSTSRDDQGRQG